VPVTAFDIKRMVDNGVDIDKLLWRNPDGSVHLVAEPDCPFLKDNLCTIYAFRPETCFIYPLQCGDKNQLSIRLFCAPTLEMTRKVVVDAMNEGGKILLPDLTIIAE
jgi:Fe-S-cluster containining protein